MIDLNNWRIKRKCLNEKKDDELNILYSFQNIFQLETAHYILFFLFKLSI